MAGYYFKSLGRKKFETANGVIETDYMILDQLSVWGRKFEAVRVYTLDFIDTGILSPYEGVIGLDILQKFSITFDFPGEKLVIE